MASTKNTKKTPTKNIKKTPTKTTKKTPTKNIKKTPTKTTKKTPVTKTTKKTAHPWVEGYYIYTTYTTLSDGCDCGVGEACDICVSDDE